MMPRANVSSPARPWVAPLTARCPCRSLHPHVVRSFDTAAGYSGTRLPNTARAPRRARSSTPRHL
eukprot:12527180-Alexandrium_andersonii.AAC.1